MLWGLYEYLVFSVDVLPYFTGMLSKLFPHKYNIKLNNRVKEME